MELHGFQTLLNRLVTQEKMNIDTISTDRHVQIRKLMRTQYSEINHVVDPWHVIKGLIKKLNLKAKKKECQSLCKQHLF